MADRTTPPTSDPWSQWRAATRARVGLGRAGDATRLVDVLAFQHAHARARDAVHTPLDTEALAREVSPHACIHVQSRASDRSTYLCRPDLGRRLDPECIGSLQHLAPDVVFIAADGLSAVAVQRHAATLFAETKVRLPRWIIGPFIVATQARVALGDEIGALLGAAFCVVMIGERPGLSVADGLGVYLTYGPRLGRADSERNCISNIQGGAAASGSGGLGIAAAAHKLAWLLNEGRRLGLTGIGLKDGAPVLEHNSSRIDGAT